MKLSYLYLSKYLNIILLFLGNLLMARYYGPTLQGMFLSSIFIANTILLYTEIGLSDNIMFFCNIKRCEIYYTIIHLLFICFLSIIGLYIFFIIKEIQINFIYLLFLLILFIIKLYLSSLIRVIDINIYVRYLLLESILIFLSILITIIIQNYSIYILFNLYILVNVLINIFLFYKILNRNIKIIHNFSVSFKEYMKYAFHTYVYKILNSSESHIDKIIILFYLAPKDFAIYSIAVIWTNLLYLVIVSPLSSIFLPLLKKWNDNTKKENVLIIFKILITISSFFGVIVWSLSNIIIENLYGKEYIKAVIVIKILILGSIIRAPMSIIAYYFKSIGSPETNVKVSIYTLPINIILNILLIPEMGIVGAAIASLISYSLFGVILFLKFLKNTNYKLRNIFIVNKLEFLKIYKIINKDL